MNLVTAQAAVALAAVLLVAAQAHAEPKTITLDGCMKVEQEMRKDGDRQTMTVKCTGEANDPQVREESGLTVSGSVGRGFVGSETPCLHDDGIGHWVRC